MNIQSPPGEINTSEPVSVMELKTPVVLPRTEPPRESWRLNFRKRKLTAVCSHQTRIGNLDAHLI